MCSIALQFKEASPSLRGWVAWVGIRTHMFTDMIQIRLFMHSVSAVCACLKDAERVERRESC